jgi:hypothetical protein
MSIFGTEDLVETLVEEVDVGVSSQLGKVDHSCYAVSMDSVNKESTRFASFFGRSRFHIPFLIRRMTIVKTSTIPSLVGEKRLPLCAISHRLSTLCKVACSFAMALELPCYQRKRALLRVRYD